MKFGTICIGHIRKKIAIYASLYIKKIFNNQAFWDATGYFDSMINSNNAYLQGVVITLLENVHCSNFIFIFYLFLRHVRTWNTLTLYTYKYTYKYVCRYIFKYILLRKIRTYSGISATLKCPSSNLYKSWRWIKELELLHT